MTYPWKKASDDVKRDIWRDALEVEHGNITNAAMFVGISRAQATRITKQFDLGPFAAELRLKHGGGARVQIGFMKGRVLGRPIRIKGS